MKLRKLIGTGGTLRDRLNDEFITRKAFIKVLDIIEGNYHFSEEMEEDNIISMMVSEAMKQSKCSLNPLLLAKQAKEYLNMYK